MCMGKIKILDGESIYQRISAIIIAFMSLLTFYPLFYILALSFTTEAEWGEKGGLVFWPAHPTLVAYSNVLNNGSMFYHAFWISILRTVIGTGVILCSTLTLGYILSRKTLPGRKFMLICVLITILFNGGLIPSYLVIRDTRIYDTFWALIIPGFVDTWSALIFKQFFEGIPADIEESAKMDGVSEYLLMTKIIVPMSKPVMAAISLFIAVALWNDWFGPLVYTKSDTLKPFQLILRNMFADSNMGANINVLHMDHTANRVSVTSLKMAVAVIGVVPILAVYPFLQKYFIKGVYFGAVKG